MTRTTLHTTPPGYYLAREAPLGQLYALCFSWRVVTWMFIQTVVFVVAGVTAYQSMAIPYLDPLWGDAEQRRHLLHGQQTCLAQPIIARHEPTRLGEPIHRCIHRVAVMYE